MRDLSTACYSRFEAGALDDRRESAGSRAYSLDEPFSPRAREIHTASLTMSEQKGIDALCPALDALPEGEVRIPLPGSASSLAVMSRDNPSPYQRGLRS